MDEHREAAACGVMAMSATFFSIQSLLSNALTRRFSHWLVAFVYGLPGLIGSTCLLGREKWKDPSYSMQGSAASRRLLDLFALLCGLNILFTIWAFSLLTLPTSAVLLLTEPVVTNLVAMLTLRERLTASRTLLCLSGLGGTVLVVQPRWIFKDNASHEAESTEGVVYAFAAVTLVSFSNIIVRKLQENGEHVYVVNASSYIGFFAVGLVGMLVDKSAPELVRGTTTDFCMMAALGLVVFCARLCKIKALMMTRVSGLVIVVRYLDVPLCFVWNAIFLKADANAFTFVGGVMVLGSALMPIAKPAWFVRGANSQQALIPNKRSFGL